MRFCTTTRIISLFCLVRLKGFEPPTLWFVAKYSIQLSYRRVLLQTTLTTVIIITLFYGFVKGFFEKKR